jgi:hypothetical protein
MVSVEKETQELVLNLRVTRKLYEQLARLAAEDKRKVSAYARLVLEDHVARRKVKPKGA